MKKIDARAASIVIRTKHALESMYVGGYATRKRGFGFEFDQLRDYDIGDDIRSIDWAASARTDDLFVREYREERSRTICVLIDTSSSMRFGSNGKTKLDVAKDIGIALATGAWHGQDALGLGTFSDGLDRWMPPRIGHEQYVQVVSMCSAIRSDAWQRKTELKRALVHGRPRVSSRALWIVISDFHDETIHRALGALHQAQEVAVIRLIDEMEICPPQISGCTFHDCEQSEKRENSADYSHWLGVSGQSYRNEQKQLLTRQGVDCFDCVIQHEWLKPLIKFFCYRGAP